MRQAARIGKRRSGSLREGPVSRTSDRSASAERVLRLKPRPRICVHRRQPRRDSVYTGEAFGEIPPELTPLPRRLRGRGGVRGKPPTGMPAARTSSPRKAPGMWAHRHRQRRICGHITFAGAAFCGQSRSQSQQSRGAHGLRRCSNLWAQPRAWTPSSLGRRLLDRLEHGATCTDAERPAKVRLTLALGRMVSYPSFSAASRRPRSSGIHASTGARRPVAFRSRAIASARVSHARASAGAVSDSLIRETIISRCHSALPGILRRQTLVDGELGAIGGEGAVGRSPCAASTSPILSWRPTGRAASRRCRGRRRQPLGDGEAGAVGGRARRRDRPAPPARRRSCCG